MNIRKLAYSLAIVMLSYDALSTLIAINKLPTIIQDYFIRASKGRATTTPAVKKANLSKKLSKVLIGEIFAGGK